MILVPLAGGLLAWAVASRPGRSRSITFVACAAQFTLTCLAWVEAVRAGPAEAPCVAHRVEWIAAFGASYHLAMDGLSFVLLLLTALLGMAAVACSWREITVRVGAFHVCLMAVLAGITGVFLARDLLLFYLFWELMLVPMYFLVGMWGHERRIHAAVKFFMFTVVGSLVMLAAILGLAFIHAGATSVLTFELDDLLDTPLPGLAGTWLMLGFFLAFAVKLPVVPVHTWLADAHTEAPTGASVILAGLLLKTGAYGMIRFAVPLFPQASDAFSHVFALLGCVGILYGAVLAFAQTDLKRLVAYSSVSHMGFVVLGIYVGNDIALQGAVVQMVCHGLSTGALFLLAGSVAERCATRDLGRLGGLWAIAPRLGGFTVFFALAALGLPGMGNFIGEFLVLLGTFGASPGLAAAAAAGFVLSTVYALRLVQRSVHGPNTGRWNVPDLSRRELATLGVLAAFVLWLGLQPGTLLRTTRASLLPAEQALSAAPRVHSEPSGASPHGGDGDWR
jgi:NADH-quinone oxidoreductase subunit M